MLAFHAIISAYGFWLPNDPRGSWSEFVGGWELFRFGGQATKVPTTYSLANRPHHAPHRKATKALLKHPAVTFSGQHALSIAMGFRDTADAAGYRILAMAFLPEHIHVVIGAAQRDPARVIGHLKRGATDRLIADGLHPCTSAATLTHSCWSERAWKVFLDTQKQIARAVRYVEDNPIKEGKARQRWSFVEQHRRTFFGRHSARQAGRLTEPPRH